MPLIDLFPATWSRVPKPLRLAPLLLAGALAIASPSDVSAGANPYFRILLHAKSSSFEPCTGFLPIDCRDHLPTVNVPAAPVAIFPLLYQIEQVSGFTMAFQWPGWSLTFGLWDCQVGQICKRTLGTPPNNQIVDCNFNCITSPPMVVVTGRFFLVPAGNPGCVSQVIPDWPNGLHVRDCNGDFDLIADPISLRLGKVCVGSGGITGCDDVIAVEASTWGKIKATY